MAWQSPTLESLRALARSYVTAQLRSVPMIANSILRVIADVTSAVGFSVLQYLNWLALQLMPDTAVGAWLIRFANIWVGGIKAATFGNGVLTVTGTEGTLVPNGSQLTFTGSDGAILLQTTQEATVGSSATPIPFVALVAGATGIVVGSALNFSKGISGVDGASATVISFNDGIDEETPDETRVRVLDRIRQPPMGGDADDYVQWALAVPGVTRAWCSPNEMGIGTITVRFMMDDLRAGPLTIDTNGNGHGAGFPEDDDVANVLAYLQTKRPVAIKDFFVFAPIPQPISFTVNDLEGTGDTGAIAANVTAMLFNKAAPAHAINGVGQPAQMIFAVWVSDAILNTVGVESFDLVMSDTVMPNNGYMAVLGTITY
jgi:uncharacterized phage protein gp47/JayE